MFYEPIFPRIETWVKKLSADFEGALPIRLSHGKSALNDKFSSLPRAAHIDIDDNSDYGTSSGSVVVNEWFSGRKTSSLDDFVVGTVDQLLLLALKQKHLALRHLGFSKKVVIIDEVHAYDAYMSVYLYEAIRWLGAYHVPVIILSATLPAKKRRDMLENYMRGRGYKWRDIEKNEQVLNSAEYPLISYSNASALCHKTFSGIERSSSVQIKKTPCLDAEAICSLVSPLFESGGIVGIIVNTVRRSQELAAKMSEHFGSENIELLHSSFIATDRIEKENRLLRQIGKGAKRPQRKIIIGTQVIEQSLDIDFDVLLTDLAPMDLLIQRIGRLHRHAINRPEAHQSPITYVIGTNESFDFDSGSVAVYGGYLLARTQYFLPDKIELPQDISVLVQNVYNNIELQVTDVLAAKLINLKSEYDNNLASKEDRAHAFRLPDPQLKCKQSISLRDWISGMNPSCNTSDENAHAQVRDSDESIEVIALKELDTGGYATFQDNFDLSSNLDENAKTIARQTLVLPRVFSKPYQFEKTLKLLEEYNLKRLNPWQDQPWLHGTLGIIFKKDSKSSKTQYTFKLNGYKLVYDIQSGLIYEKEVDDAKV